MNGLRLRADHLDIVAFECAVLVQRHGGVERGLAAERREQHQLALRAELLHLLLLANDDLLHRLGRDRLDVSAVGELRVGHDGGRVGVHEHHAVALFLERLARLGAGVIELARLPNDDGAGADN